MARTRKERLTSGLKVVRDQLLDSLQGCQAEEFEWKPRPDMKSVKEMIRECGAVEKVLVNYARSGEQLDFQKAVQWTGEDLPSTLSDLEVIRRDTIQYINVLKDADFEQTRKNRRGEETEIEEFLRSIYTHEYYHVGQIIYNRWLLGYNPYKKQQ
ncbi:DinB family protein [Candidatus Acetothermia bacterium]|nr:DinB family protein [Candidatus Acetothermia bacterium]MBI3643412.1 DinB family protein [Candidatus Acetothermia bacterium]